MIRVLNSVHKLNLPTLIAIGIGACTVIDGAPWLAVLADLFNFPLPEVIRCKIF
jgi:hypothetical protein